MQFSRKIVINFNWWCDDENMEEIDFETNDLLEGHAEDIIFKMKQEGYMSGELLTYIDGIQYRGWYDINYV